MHTKTLFTVTLTLMLLFYSSFVSAEIYKWVDAKGETHFSDKPNKSAPVKVTKQPQSMKKQVLKEIAVQSKKSPNRAVPRSKPVYRTAKIIQGKKTRQRSKLVRKVETEKPGPITTQQTDMLFASMDATFYDLEQIVELTPETALPKAKTISNFKQSLCRDNRRHLAVLQEKGFDYYYDNEGELRVAWGVEGFYRQKKRYLSAPEVATKIKAISVEVERYCDNLLDKTLQAKARLDWIRSEYCDVSKVILADLEHPFMRTSEGEIKAQEKEVDRFCMDYPTNKYRDDERYYPTSLQVERLQQKHFLYR